MGRLSEEEVIARRFHIDRPPFLVVGSLSQHPVTFARLRATNCGLGRTAEVPPEEAFAFQVLLAELPSTECWIGGKHVHVPTSPPGSTFLFDLTSNPVTLLDRPFDTVRFYMPRSTLEKMSHENGKGNVRGLTSRSFGVVDRRMYGLARSVAAAMEDGTSDRTLFAEAIALAFHVHVATTYGTGSFDDQLGGARGCLAPWQLRRACDMMLANFTSQSSIAAMAAECRISPSHFARAFKRTTGSAPHQWLVMRRMETAKDLLLHPKTRISEVALACGFVDQSHFSAVFGKQAGVTPGKWRRQRLK